MTGLPDVAPETPGQQLPDPKDLAPVANRYFEASRLAAQGRVGEAIAAYKSVVGEAPSLAPGWDRLAALLVASGRFAEAGEALTSLLKLYPEDGRAAEAERRLQALLGPAADRGAVRGGRGRLGLARREDAGRRRPRGRAQGRRRGRAAQGRGGAQEALSRRRCASAGEDAGPTLSR